MEPLDSHDDITPEQTARDIESLHLYHKLNCDASNRTRLALAALGVPDVVILGQLDNDQIEVVTDTPEQLPLDPHDLRRVGAFLSSVYFRKVSDRYL